MTEGRGGKARTWNGRYVNIAHRRSPSELTPLIQQNLALQQQVEQLTAQIHQGSPQQSVPVVAAQGLGAEPQTSPVGPNTLLPPPPHVFGHSRGASSSSVGGHARQRSFGHARRHSLAVSEARRAAQERAEGGASPTLAGAASGPAPLNVSTSLGTPPSLGSQSLAAPGSLGAPGSPGPLEFRFPPPSPDRRRGGHSRSQSLSTPYRRQSPQAFQFPPDPHHPHQQQQQHFQQQQHHHHHLGSGASYASYAQASPYSHKPRASNASDFSPQQQNQQGRKSLFVPYLPQSAIPEMLADGLLVTGTLRVNHKNRSYAYVSTDLLDADVFIAGSKDRNRALEGDFVAVELLDVDDVWQQKREKEERKRRREGDTSDARLVESQEGQLRRRGSLRQREPQKRSDDVEVEGQTLLLREEPGSSAQLGDDEKPLYSGHVVAILERPAGQLFSGTLGLLRPSSQATKERHSRTASSSSFSGPADEASAPTPTPTPTPTAPQQRPKIVWFKPVDKCVPLMAIPTEQAPADLIDNPQAYANQVFVAQIKRWPITSLHPFGMLVEKLGTFGDPKVSQTAILREFNFGPHRFSDAAVADAAESGRQMQQVASELPLVASSVAILADDFAASTTTTNANEVVLAAHVLDVTPFIDRDGALDRELRHKSAGVYMEAFSSPLVSSDAARAALKFAVGRRLPVLTVEFHLSSGEIAVRREAVEPRGDARENRGLIAQFEAPATILRRRRGLGSFDDKSLDLSALLDVVVPARPPLSDATREELIVTEIQHAVNAGIASELLRSTTVGLSTLVRREGEPPLARLEQVAKMLRLQGIRADTSSAHALASSLAAQLSPKQQQAVKAVLAKILASQRYAVAQNTHPGQLGHYWFGFDAYTHFARPLLRYADQVVARQVHSMLGVRKSTPRSGTSTPRSGTSTPALESRPASSDGARGSGDHYYKAPTLGSPVAVPDEDQAPQLASELSFRYDWARGAQDQSFHLALSQKLGTAERLYTGVVTAVYESAFDVVVPELSLEKRVHGDQLPLVKAEFHPLRQMLELFWKSSERDATDAAPGLTVSGANEDISEDVRAKLVLRDGNVQEIRPLLEVPVLVKGIVQDRVLPSIVVVAVNPFAPAQDTRHY